MASDTAPAPDKPKRRQKARSPLVVEIEPRLLDIAGAARYLGNVSEWTVRALVADEHIKPVVLPSVRHPGESGRRLLFDRADLDACVDRWKAAS